MPYFPARWTASLAAAALLTLPFAAAAQAQDPKDSPKQNITQETKIDAAASKMHLGAARDTLSQLTAMPEAARLEGDARAQVTQIISSFNELITTQSDWRSAYAKVDSALSTLLGPEAPDQPPAATGVTGAVGTSGAAAALDPAVRAKLVEFRTHLKEFERAAGGSSSGAMSPAIAPGSTSNPANPARAMNPSNSTAPAAPAAAPADQTKAAEAAGHSEADKHLDAISAILNQSKTGTLTKAQTAALKKHVAELRALLAQSK
jgi:hypothetical protein